MKKLAIPAFVLGMLAFGFSAQPAKADVSVRVSIGRFYNQLAPYGRWVRCRYGRCWVPRRVSRRWQPYSNGRWVYTEYGWTWASRDPWGGDPYHYGTWVYLSGYGWAWVPGTVWAPAWVTWSYSDRYIGWAPLPPSVVFGGSGYSGRPVVVSQTQYVFVPTNRFVDTDVTTAWVSPQQSATIFRQTRPMTQFAISDGYVRNTGIPMETIQRATGARIETRAIGSANTAAHTMTEGGGGNRQVAVVAPAHDVDAAMTAGPQSGREPVAPQTEARPERHEPKAQRAPREQEAPPARAHGREVPPPPAPAPVVVQQPPPHEAPVPAGQVAPPEQKPGHGNPPKGKEKKEKH